MVIKIKNHNEYSNCDSYFTQLLILYCYCAEEYIFSKMVVFGVNRALASKILRVKLHRCKEIRFFILYCNGCSLYHNNNCNFDLKKLVPARFFLLKGFVGGNRYLMRNNRHSEIMYIFLYFFCKFSCDTTHIFKHSTTCN